MENNTIKRLIHRGTGGQQGWIFSINGIISTIPSSTWKDPPKIVVLEEENEKQRKDNEIRIGI